jgi:hypothetical protein
MNATENTAARLADTLNIDANALSCEGQNYIITTGTGDGDFAYYADAVESWLDADSTPDTPHYSDDFCASLDPVDDDTELALIVFRALDVSIDCAGTCSPVVANLEAVCWLYDNVDSATWDRLVGSQSREEFAAECDDDIEDAWADYLEHIESQA